MFVIDKRSRLCFSFDYPQPWVLYFLFSYLECPPTDDSFENFENAADRASGEFSDPDQLVQWLSDHGKCGKEMPIRWSHFRQRYGHKSKSALLEVIAFFLNETSAPKRIVA
jgi:hypothetical protein